MSIVLGPGTLEIGAVGSEIDVSCLVNGARVTPTKTEGDATQKLCGSKSPGAINKPTPAVKTARIITRGFIRTMKSGTRAVSPDHEGNGRRETGNAVVFMLNPLGGKRCVLCREQTPVSVFSRFDVV